MECSFVRVLGRHEGSGWGGAPWLSPLAVIYAQDKWSHSTRDTERKERSLKSLGNNEAEFR